MEKWIEKFNALSIGEKIILPAGVVLFIVGFFPWYSVGGGSVTGGDLTYHVSGVSRNAWGDFGAFWSILAIIIGLAMAVVVGLKAFSTVAIPENVGGVTWPKIHLGAGVVVLVFLLIKFLSNHDYTTFGLYLGVLAGAALAVGGFLMFREESAA